jgi:hypothetical protein
MDAATNNLNNLNNLNKLTNQKDEKKKKISIKAQRTELSSVIRRDFPSQARHQCSLFNSRGNTGARASQLGAPGTSVSKKG